MSDAVRQVHRPEQRRRAANQLSLPQPRQRQASGVQRRIGADEQLITLTEAAKLLPEVDGGGCSRRVRARAPAKAKKHQAYREGFRLYA